jgi:thiol-disulfide isomerase/thioredoxin
VRPLPVVRTLATALAAGALLGCVGPHPARGRRFVAPPRAGVSPVAARVQRAFAAARRHGRGSRAIWSFLAERYDRDGDGRVVAAEYPRKAARFEALDADRDGALTRADFEAPTRMDAYVAEFVWTRIALAAAPAPAAAAGEGEGRRAGPPDLDEASLARAFSRVDADGDGRVREPELAEALAAAERVPTDAMPDFPRGVRPFPSLLAVADPDASGDVTLAEVEAWRAARAAEPEEGPPPDPERAKARARGVPVGEPAPDFTLPRSDGGGDVSLLSFRGVRPVVLVFGSHTCPPFRHVAPALRRIVDSWRDRVQFLFVYIREAHAVDGPSPMPSPDQPVVEEPVTPEERREVAAACALDLGFVSFPTVVDGLDDATAKAWAASPVRIYLVGLDGRVAYGSAPGPFGLDPEGLEEALVRTVGRAPAAGSRRR